MPSSRSDVTDLLAAVADGDASANDELIRVVYEELKRIARGHVRRSAQGLTVNPTTLVHEAWMKFARLDKRAIEGSAHFYNVIAQAMRHILSDLAERKRAHKHGGALVRTELGEGIEQEDKPLDEMIAIDAAVNDLRACDPDLSTVVEWHYFVGLSLAEIAEHRGVSERTVKRDLAMARAFLKDAMKGTTRAT